MLLRVSEDGGRFILSENIVKSCCLGEDRDASCFLCDERNEICFRWEEDMQVVGGKGANYVLSNGRTVRSVFVNERRRRNFDGNGGRETTCFVREKIVVVGEIRLLFRLSFMKELIFIITVKNMPFIYFSSYCPAFIFISLCIWIKLAFS